MKSYRAEEELIFDKNSSHSIHSFWIKKSRFPSFWHFHPEIELTFIKQGSGIRVVGDSIQSFEKNDLVLLGSNLPHNWISFDESITSEAFVLQFSSRIFESFSEFDELNQFLEAAKKGYFFPTPGKLILDKIDEFTTLPDPLKFSATIEILFELVKNHHKTTLASQDYVIPASYNKSQKRYEIVTDYVLNNISGRISLQEISGIANMNKEAFSRWFKQINGHSFTTYLNKTRIEISCHLLLNTSESVNDICYKVGFESQSQFHRCFSSFKNTSPLQFRKLRSKNLTKLIHSPHKE
ncbi:MAG: helix-turn-helix domain-containing protein [Balneola sp.]|nr:MAG: helix-turn-helix domain-containing protein [Balneola sp.]